MNNTIKEVSDRRCRLGKFYKVLSYANGKTEHLSDAKDMKTGVLTCLPKQHGHWLLKLHKEQWVLSYLRGWTQLFGLLQ